MLPWLPFLAVVGGIGLPYAVSVVGVIPSDRDKQWPIWLPKFNIVVLIGALGSY